MGVEDLKKVAQPENFTGDNQAQPLDEKPKKRGRPKGSTSKKKEPAQVPPSMPTPAFLFLVSMPFNVWSNATKQDFIKLDQNETKNLALVTEQVVNQYFPSIPTQHAVLFQFAFTVAATVGCRVAGLNKIKQERKKADERNKSEQSDSSVRSEGFGQVDLNEGTPANVVTPHSI